LTLHGGPGAGHDYLEPLEALASERPVVFFDQLGCGKSDQPADRSLWRIERFVREINAVRDALRLTDIHLLGHSWGGWLGIEYMLSKPAGIASLILASTSASIKEFVREAAALKAQLPADVRATMERYEASGDYANSAYEEAVMTFYKRHICRLDPWPDPLMRTVKNLAGNPVYETMNGPNEFTVTGNLKDWDRTGRLGEITVPTLVTVGGHDEVTANCANTIHRRISNSELRLFENSSHTAMLEEPDQFIRVVRGFHRRIEGQRSAPPKR
jgi:proline-specific peptidase